MKLTSLDKIQKRMEEYIWATNKLGLVKMLSLPRWSLTRLYWVLMMVLLSKRVEAAGEWLLTDPSLLRRETSHCNRVHIWAQLALLNKRMVMWLSVQLLKGKSRHLMKQIQCMLPQAQANYVVSQQKQSLRWKQEHSLFNVKEMLLLLIVARRVLQETTIRCSKTISIWARVFLRETSAVWRLTKSIRWWALLVVKCKTLMSEAVNSLSVSIRSPLNSDQLAKRITSLLKWQIEVRLLSLRNLIRRLPIFKMDLTTLVWWIKELQTKMASWRKKVRDSLSMLSDKLSWTGITRRTWSNRCNKQ